MSQSRQTRVLSVRLSLAALQSCFDLCEMLEHPTNGGSSAIARTVEVLTSNLRKEGKLPVYKKEELARLVETFMAKKNPTSMASLEKLSSFDLYPEASLPSQRTQLTSEDFAPQQKFDGVCNQPDKTERELERERLDEDREYEDLIEEQIREQMLSDENDLLSKIMIS